MQGRTAPTDQQVSHYPTANYAGLFVDHGHGGAGMPDASTGEALFSVAR